MTDPANPSDAKKVDESWKEEARRAKGSADKAPRERHEHGGLPKPDFDFLVNSLAMQALMCLGHLAHPGTEEVQLDLEGAKHSIDMLDMLSAKTKGNLTDDESKLLQTTLYDLRVRYIAASRPSVL